LLIASDVKRNAEHMTLGFPVLDANPTVEESRWYLGPL